MPKQKNKEAQTVEDLLRDLLIVQLGMAHLTQRQIREVVGVDMNRVTRIMRHFPKSKE